MVGVGATPVTGGKGNDRFEFLAKVEAAKNQSHILLDFKRVANYVRL